MAEVGMPDIQSVFNDIARSYDAGNRGIPRVFAKHIASLTTPITSTSIIHDNACGPAVVTSELFATGNTAPARLEATDISPPMVSAATEIAKAGDWNFVKTSQMDATKLAFEDNTFTHSFTNMLIPTQPPAIAEIHRTLQLGGTAFYTAWNYHGLIDLWKRVSELIFPDAEAPQRVKAQWPTEAMLRGLFEKAGFSAENVEIRLRSERHAFKSVEELATLVDSPFAKMLQKGWKPEEEERVSGLLEQALTREEKETKSVEIAAWIIIARKWWRPTKRIVSSKA